MGNVLQNTGGNTLKGHGGGVVGSAAAVTYGLLWSDGIEPTGSTLYPLEAGKRIWYVDLDAGVDGNGDEGTPANHFTDIVGWFSGGNYQLGSMVGGDQLWVTGTGAPTKDSNGVSNMKIDIAREAQLGTVVEPTVIRSWKGRSRALFDGEYTADLGITVAPTSGSTNGIVILNIAGTKNTAPAVDVDDNVSFVRVVSCYAYFNYALSGGPASTYGGILVRCSNGLRDIEVNNNKAHDNNTTNGVTVQASNNIGGINLLCQSSADPLSTVKFFLNDVTNENYAIRHKHSGNCAFSSYSNNLSNSNVLHYIRNAGTNDIYDNIGNTADVDVRMESESQSSERNVSYHDNALNEVDIVIGTSGVMVHNNVVDWADNTYAHATYTGPVLVFGGNLSDN